MVWIWWDPGLFFVSFPVGEDENEFKNFMLPLTVSFESVAQMLNNSLEQEEAKVGLFQLQGNKLLMEKTYSRAPVQPQIVISALFLSVEMYIPVYWYINTCMHMRIMKYVGSGDTKAMNDCHERNFVQIFDKDFGIFSALWIKWPRLSSICNQRGNVNSLIVHLFHTSLFYAVSYCVY